VRAYENKFESQYGRKPNLGEIGKEFNMDHDKVLEVLNYEISFQTLHGRDEDHPGFESVLEDENHLDARDEIWHQEAQERLSNAFKFLTERERDVLTHRYRIYENGKKMSLRKVGQLMGLSAEGVRRIEEQAMTKLRRPSIMAKMETLFAS
jgi:RNA polymerase sigma factor (sigma-70 family)